MIEQENHSQKITNQTFQQLKKQILKQYYRYLNLIKRTNNLTQDLQFTQYTNNSDYQQLTLIGWLYAVQPLKIKIKGVNKNNQGFFQQKQQQFMVPMLNTNIQFPFKNSYEVKNISNSNNNNINSKNNNKTTNSNNPITSLSQNQGDIKTTISSNYSKIQNNNSQPLSQASIAAGVHQLNTLKQRIKNNLICTKAYYKKNLKSFNNIIRDSKQLKQYYNYSNTNSLANNQQLFNLQNTQNLRFIFCFTDLQLTYWNYKFYFMFTQKSKMLTLDMKVYKQYYQYMEKFINFSFSYLQMPLKNITLTPQTILQGYPLIHLQQYSTMIQPLSFIGILKQYSIQQNRSGNAGNRSDKQVILIFYQDNLRPKSDQLGVAKLIIKLSIFQHVEQIVNYLKIGYLYLVINANISVSDSVNILYKMKNNWQQNLINLDIYKSSDLKYLNSLPFTPLNSLNLPNIHRNIIKIKAILYKIQQLYGKVTCSKCKIKFLGQKVCHICESQQNQLHLWTNALISDSKSIAQISLETIQTIQFFNLTQEHINLMKKKCLSIQQKVGNSYNQNKFHQIFNIYAYYSSNNNKNSFSNSINKQDYSQEFYTYIGCQFIQKTLLGICRYNSNQNFNSTLNQQQKIQFQNCFQSSNQFMKKNKNKIHFNGFNKKINKNISALVANIKVIKVLDEQYKSQIIIQE